VQIVELKRSTTDGGAITELGRFAAGMHAGCRASSASRHQLLEMEPDAVKAFHLHHADRRVVTRACDKLLWC